MRAAPPVSVHARGGSGWRALRALAPTLAAAVCSAWALQWAGLGDAAAVGIAAAAGAAVALLAWHATDGRASTLAWDGAQWSVDGVPGRLDLMIELPAWLLVRLRPAAGGAARWVAVTAAEAGAAETLLRAALHARPGAAAAPVPRAAGPDDT